MIERLKRSGIDPKLELKGGRLKGKTLVFTGELQRMTREQAKEAVVQQGGRVSEGVSARTDFLIVGSNPGATKTSDARRHGTRTIRETGFLRLIR
jgi:DNA ligase (NAD+)